jgi:hypothetical protein
MSCALGTEPDPAISGVTAKDFDGVAPEADPHGVLPLLHGDNAHSSGGRATGSADLPGHASLFLRVHFPSGRLVIMTETSMLGAMSIESMASY